MNCQTLITGAGSKIVSCLLQKDIGDYRLCSKQLFDFSDLDTYLKVGLVECDRFVFAHGMIHSKNILHMTAKEIDESMHVNLLSTVLLCEEALKNPLARICVIGSESGLKHSYDTCYGLSKIALHGYVRERKIRYPEQQLVCVAPAMIEDSRMTANRADKENVARAAKTNPKGRGLYSQEVADMVYNLLWGNSGYVTNTVVEMYGGKFARA